MVKILINDWIKIREEKVLNNNVSEDNINIYYL